MALKSLFTRRVPDETKNTSTKTASTTSLEKSGLDSQASFGTVPPLSTTNSPTPRRTCNKNKSRELFGAYSGGGYVARAASTTSTATANTTTPTPRRLRILLLHGYHGSASVISTQASSLAAALAPIADLVPIDAPSLARGSYGWWHARNDPATGSVVYSGWDATRRALQEVFATQGPFDGVLGMSQGAVLTSVLTGMNGGPEGGVKFNFAVMVGGFPANDTKLASFYEDETKYMIPSLHVYGTSDMIVAPSATVELSRKFKNARVVVHSGGHVIPRESDAEGRIVEFVKEQYGKQR